LDETVQEEHKEGTCLTGTVPSVREEIKSESWESWQDSIPEKVKLEIPVAGYFFS